MGQLFLYTDLKVYLPDGSYIFLTGDITAAGLPLRVDEGWPYSDKLFKKVDSNQWISVDVR